MTKKQIQLRAAVAAVGAQPVGRGWWVHYDAEMQCWRQATSANMRLLACYMFNGAVIKGGYSFWITMTGQRAMPAGWEPGR